MTTTTLANACFIDGSTVTESIWLNYSKLIQARFHKNFPQSLLFDSGLPVEVIENHLLMEIYYPLGFPALLAEKLSEQVKNLAESPQDNAPSGNCFVLHLPSVAGDISVLARLIERQLRCQPSHDAVSVGRRLRSKWIGWLGFGCGLLETIRGVVNIRWVKKLSPAPTRQPLPKNLFLIFSGSFNHTRHIWQLLQLSLARTTPAVILLLGHRPLDSDLLAIARKCNLSVFSLVRLRDILWAGMKLMPCWHRIQKLQFRVEQDLSLQLGIRYQTQAAAWWLRGFLHERGIAAVRFENAELTLAVFGLIAHADSRMADLALRKRGVKTIHWLHGIVEDPLHYRANATICLCKNQSDVGLRTQHGNYQYCFCIATKQSPKPSLKDVATPEIQSGLLLVTNLIHPDNRFIHSGSPAALLALLRLVADYAAHNNIALLTWRPHPRETMSLQFDQFKKVATRLGFQVSNAIDMPTQVKQHRYIVSTFSGSIGDIAMTGRVPAVYAGLPYELGGHWGRLPNAIKFRSVAELKTVLSHAENPDFNLSLRSALRAQYEMYPLDLNEVLAEFERVRHIPNQQVLEAKSAP